MNCFEFDRPSRESTYAMKFVILKHNLLYYSTVNDLGLSPALRIACIVS